ncbi:glycoside hydrolase family protein [Microcoleus sp. S13_C5]|uniref:glycoside hydrolase family protein n=1 Tax=Microcoleus sp. S13_C5 TaxID=3055411 RepID=UPI002FD3486A
MRLSSSSTFSKEKTKMPRSLEIFGDGRVYEIKDDLAVKVTETNGQVKALIDALKFSVAKTYNINPPEKQPPEVAERRGSKHINGEGFKLLTTFEGCELTAYDDGGGVWTIGYGHTGDDVFPGQTISQTQAEELLHLDLEKFESFVEDAVEVEINDNHFSALVCFCFNVGPEAFGDSTLLKLLNQGNYQGAANQFPVWNKVNGEPWLGLTRRRLAERALFLGNPWQSFLTYEGTGEEVTGETISEAPRTLKLTAPVMQGEDVRQVQKALKAAGINLEPDGVFGNDTDKAVRQFQEQKGLMADGVVGAQTRKELGL